MKKTKLICFEGGEMVGKTTAIQNVKEQLIADGYTVYVTREPGGCDIAEDIRHILLDDKYTSKMDTYTEAMLFAAARRAHLLNKIIPMIENNTYDYIIMDRYVMSSLVYQGYMKSTELFEDTLTEEFSRSYATSFEKIFHINSDAIEINSKLIIPDITFILDMECEDALSRPRVAADKNRLDAKPLEWHKHIREGYLRARTFMRDRIHATVYIMDASAQQDIVLRNIMEKLRRL